MNKIAEAPTVSPRQSSGVLPASGTGETAQKKKAGAAWGRLLYSKRAGWQKRAEAVRTAQTRVTVRTKRERQQNSSRHVQKCAQNADSPQTQTNREEPVRTEQTQLR